MSKRYAVLGLSVFLALALAVPALGGPSNPVASISATAKQIANKALKKAKAAQATANSALGTANSAQSEAKKAQATGTSAQATANTAQSTASSAQGTANSAKSIAEAAKTAAAAAEANANNRVSGVNGRFGTSTPEDTTTPKETSAHCENEETEEVTGGGFSVFGAGANQVTITHSEPVFPLYGRGWFVAGRAISGTPTWELQAVVFCAHK
jgi:hypothetical protein